MGYGLGTFYWDNFPYVYDQFMVSKGFLKDESSFTVDTASIAIEKYPEMIKPGSTYEVPRRLGRPSQSYDAGGYSDNYPISIKISEE